MMNDEMRSGRAVQAFAAGAFAVALVLGAGTAEARRGYAPDYVVAESDFGNGSVRGAIRPSRHGWQVRLPRGTWIDCVRNCSDTLRRQTVDFWESNFPDAPGSGRGYLTWDFWY